MTEFLTRIAAQNTGRMVRDSAVGLQQTLDRLSGGRRPEGSAPVIPPGEELRIASQGRRNAVDGVALLQLAGGVLQDMEELLGRASALTERTADPSMDDETRAGLNADYQNLLRSVVDLGAEARFNGSKVFSGQPMTLPLGPGLTYALQVPPSGEGPEALLGEALQSRIDSPEAAAKAQKVIQQAAMNLQGQRVGLEGQLSELRTLGSALGIQAENLSAAGTPIQDARLADELVGLTTFQIAERAELRVLGQAAQARQQVLDLLR